MNVALLNPWFWPEVRRGSERLVHDLAVDLVALGHRARVLTSHRARPTRTMEDGFEVVRSYRPPSLPLRVRSFQDGLTHLPFTYRELQRGDDDAAVAAYMTDGLAAVRWHEQTGKPAVFAYMGVPQRNVISSYRKRMQILEHVTTRAQAVVALTEAAQRGIWRWFGVESHVIYPGTDLDRFTPEPAARATVPTILCAADAGDDRKRAPLLVAAFARVRNERPDARLILLAPSDPAKQPPLEAPGVEFADVDSDGIRALYREAWVSGLASYNEAFGLVLVESLACGTPVFGMDDGGVPEIIDRPGIGRMFDGTEDDLARVLLETLELAEDKGTAAACREHAARFSSRRSAERYVELLRALR